MNTKKENIFKLKKMNIKVIVALLMLVGGPILSFSRGDTKTITANVYDSDGSSIFVASVMVKGASNGVGSFDTKKANVVSGNVVDTPLTQEVVALEVVSVIGSRGKPRTSIESPVPIDAISVTELLQTGQMDMGQSIHYTVPSFSAQKFGINDLAPLIDPAQLRGLGSDQTLLLVNGKRRHKVSFFSLNEGVGQGQLGNDMNSIPAAAVEQVEVLRDGAAAQYGSDAIAGVINMQLKKRRSGGSVTLGIASTVTSPKYDNVITNAPKKEGESIYGSDVIYDGFTFNSAVNFGLPWGEKGYINTTLTFSHADPTDRSGIYSHSSGWYTAAQRAAAGLTDEQLQTLNAINPDRAVLGTARNTNGGIFINAGRELSKSWDFYAFGGFTKKYIVGGVFTRTPARVSRAVLEIFPDGYNPEVPSDLTDWQILSGIKGTLGNDWILDFSLGYSGNVLQLYARNTVNPSMAAKSPTSFYTGGLKVTQTILNVDAVKELSKVFTVAFGTEFRIETFEQLAGQKESWFPGDSATAVTGGRDIGSSGREGFRPKSVGAWSRNNLGIYVEVDADITKNFLLSFAGRFESYSDYGSDYALKIAGRYNFSDIITLRASFNRSFRAPALAQTHYSNYSSIAFDGSGGSVVSPTLPVRDSRFQSAFGFKNLKSETSVDLTFGLATKHRVLGGTLNASLDFYRIAVADRLLMATVAASDFAAFNNSGFDNITFFANAINTVSLGADLVVHYKKSFSSRSRLGLSFALNLNRTQIDKLNLTSQLEGKITYKRTANGSDPFIYLVEGTPTNKIIFTPSYTYGPVTFLFRITNFGEVTEPRLRYSATLGEWDDNPPGGGEPQKLSAKAIVDFSITGRIGKKIAITYSINNLFDTYPDMLAESQVRGEVIYSRRVNQFGTQGRFMNFTLSYNF